MRRNTKNSARIDNEAKNGTPGPVHHRFSHMSSRTPFSLLHLDSSSGSGSSTNKKIERSTSAKALENATATSDSSSRAVPIALPISLVDRTGNKRPHKELSGSVEALNREVENFCTTTENGTRICKPHIGKTPPDGRRAPLPVGEQLKQSCNGINNYRGFILPSTNMILAKNAIGLAGGKLHQYGTSSTRQSASSAGRSPKPSPTSSSHSRQGSNTSVASTQTKDHEKDQNDVNTNSTTNTSSSSVAYVPNFYHPNHHNHHQSSSIMSGYQTPLLTSSNNVISNNSVQASNAALAAGKAITALSGGAVPPTTILHDIQSVHDLSGIQNNAITKTATNLSQCNSPRPTSPYYYGTTPTSSQLYAYSNSSQPQKSNSYMSGQGHGHNGHNYGYCINTNVDERQEPEGAESNSNDDRDHDRDQNDRNDREQKYDREKLDHGLSDREDRSHRIPAISSQFIQSSNDKVIKPKATKAKSNPRQAGHPSYDNLNYGYPSYMRGAHHTDSHHGKSSVFQKNANANAGLHSQLKASSNRSYSTASTYSSGYSSCPSSSNSYASSIGFVGVNSCFQKFCNKIFLEKMKNFFFENFEFNFITPPYGQQHLRQ